jgi:exopolysaccharide biosynthesis protein
MIKLFTKPRRWAIVFSLLLIFAFSYVLLDTFVIPKSVTTVDTKSAIASTTAATSQSQGDATVSETSYEDENIKINIETVRKYDTNFYVADIQLADASYLQTALADNKYGRNIKETTSEMAEANDAIFAINGDYYGFRDSGYVLRNGTVYRDTARNGGTNEDLVIDKNGDFSIISEDQTSLDSLDTDEIWQILSFGPALIKDGEIAVDSSSEVSQSRNSNPRTAIGQISALHYVVIVSDGRTSESTGLSLLELAREFADRGCTTAYNLDGGGSSTMYFNGNIINHPTDGRSSGERKVSDIVYIGY